MKKIVNIIIFGLLLLIFGSYMFTFQVRQDEIAFVNHLGKNSEPIIEPGLKPKWPWPIQRVYKFDKRIHVKTTRYDQVMTQNGKSVMMQFYFGWKIKNPGAFMSNTSGSDSAARMKDAEKQLLVIVDAEKNNQVNMVATSFGSFIQSEGVEGESRVDFDKLEKAILDKANSKAEANLGVEIKFVGIRKVGVPQGSLDVVLEAMVTQWTSKSETEIHIGQQEADAIRAKARNDKETALQKARAEAKTTLAAAQADALQQFKLMEQDPKLAAFLMQLEALEKSVKKQTTLILDDSMGPFGLLRGLDSPLKKDQSKQ
jgi:regulator of protease activity HflC (stomatin/prohibitin superfamily)